MIHYALLRFCQHTRLAFLARNVPPALLMQPVDVNFDPASGVRTSPVGKGAMRCAVVVRM
jgi:hypothetical protein